MSTRTPEGVRQYEITPADRDSDEVLRAYHLNRITSQFETTISPDGARRLARLLAGKD